MVSEKAFEPNGFDLTPEAKGDIVVVESPTFYAALQALERLSLKVVEAATSPRDGIDLDSLSSVLQRHPVKACWLMPNFQNPLGSRMSDERKQALVALLAERLSSRSASFRP